MKKFLVLTLGLAMFTLVGCTNETENEVNTETPEVSFVLTDSGQTKYYDLEGNEIDAPVEGDDLYGQDAQYVSLEQSFTDNGDGTISDNNTGLMWQQTSEFDRISFDEAKEYVENLELGGYDDWRLPTIDELYSIANFNGELLLEGDSTPYLDTDYFYFEYDRMAFAGQFWSSTLYVGGAITDMETQGAFGFNFADGHIKAYGTGYYFDGTELEGEEPGCFVLAVRGEENVYGVNDFLDNNDGTINDQATGLMWSSMSSEEGMDWEAALQYAESSDYAGYSDWRLPSAKELQSIIDYSSTEIPALYTDFFTIAETDSYVWTSTTHGDFKNTAIYLAVGKAYSITDSLDEFYDWHGAGAQRSDPKTGEPDDYNMESVNAEDLVRIFNYVFLVRDTDSE